MEEIEWPDLLRSTRWAALGTVDEKGAPFVSSVAFAIDSDSLLIHVSELGAHTRNLLERPVFSLLISEPDSPENPDPQTLARLSLSGRAEALPRDAEEFAARAGIYVSTFPDSEMRFGFGDFHLIRLIPESGNFVGGFGRAKRLKGEKIVAAIGDFPSPD